ncbi:hypothetical protein DERP_002844 [Dermatophagoides pteronyssinus]|uniref:Uncharacterized protein n=1 Tax=Dermatophagoides pteronyssinus TaxID=6956 RepID=A0ABQ8JVT2_DERPT|nr:hypothetical protein DERP_002844 [Dermatophagoides pteronyssinus]
MVIIGTVVVVDVVEVELEGKRIFIPIFVLFFGLFNVYSGDFVVLVIGIVFISVESIGTTITLSVLSLFIDFINRADVVGEKFINDDDDDDDESKFVAISGIFLRSGFSVVSLPSMAESFTYFNKFSIINTTIITGGTSKPSTTYVGDSAESDDNNNGNGNGVVVVVVVTILVDDLGSSITLNIDVLAFNDK